MSREKGFTGRFLFLIGILLLHLGFPLESRAEKDDYPNRPIQVVICFGPGSSPDLSSRILAPYLEEYFKQPFLVVNKVGGGGIIGHTYLAKSKPDGYTLGQVSTIFSVYFLVHKKLEFDLESFVPICGFAKVPGFFLVRTDARWKTMKEFIADAKKNPGKFRYSTQGVASAAHALAVDFFNKAGLEVIHIPYSGAGEVITAVMGGHVEIGVSWASAGNLKAGTLRALAVSEKERLEDFPDIPTLTELGYPIVLYPMNGHVVPKGTPKRIIEKLSQAYTEILRANRVAISESFRKLEQYPIIIGPEEYYKKMKENYEYMSNSFQGIKLE